MTRVARWISGSRRRETESANKSITLGLGKGGRAEPRGRPAVPDRLRPGMHDRTASASSPLVPTAALATGTVTLSEHERRANDHDRRSRRRLR